ncbi:hypothetical protein GE061_019667 [Apolygus lucorum]|uniref:Uncharacterized protein n=1 Tax=Apolygus lucorum TaxID=248454 RepID=A0A6A4JFT0_APOLU|nr:hypothetical protein GE061_019667 [Apolygus lucorum]
MDRLRNSRLLKNACFRRENSSNRASAVCTTYEAMSYLPLAFTIFVIVLLYNSAIAAPYNSDDKLRGKEYAPQDVHLMSKKTLNNLIAGLIGLLLNLNPESKFQQRGLPYCVNDGF